MAYNTSQRFKSAAVYQRLLDPGAYQDINPHLIQPNNVPFLSKSPRDIKNRGILWTHAIYGTNLPRKIPNCTSLQSKIPRFSYEALSEEDVKQLLCRCGLNDPCKCPIDETETDQAEEVICQGKVRRRIFKGLTLKITSRDKQVIKKVSERGPPFYDARVNESTAFYQGWKWSKWTSTRSQKLPEDRPGPADYTIERKPDIIEICAEKLREHKRKTCKKLRLLDMVQRQNLIERRPGPASYSPMLPKGTELRCMGSKADRFPISKYNIGPGPADHWLKRDFDVTEIPKKWCHATLPSRVPFAVKAVRFKPRREEGPSPASYETAYRSRLVLPCTKAPFGMSAVRFRDNNECDKDDETDVESENNEFRPRDCGNLPTWQFKSKTTRIRPLKKKLNEPSPADLPQSRLKVFRPIKLQYAAPFCSSEERFLPWYNNIPVHGKEKTPGPAYYSLEKYRCQPAVFQGPLYRSQRFPDYDSQTPAPNEYKVSGGIETILSTHNQKLKYNIENQHKFNWVPPVEPKKLSLQEKQNKLLDQSIALLDTGDVFENKSTTIGSAKSSSHNPPSLQKMLRCFLYTKKIKPSF